MRARSGQKKKSTSKGKAKRKPGRPTKPKHREEVEDDGKTRRRSGRPRKSTVIIESDDDDEEMQVDDEPEEAQTSDEYTAKFPIVLTTYDMIIRDRTHLAHYDWGYIVVDEGHRLKNLNCKLMKEIKKYSSAGRMILTGTPLHVSFRIFIRCSWLNASPRIISPSYGRCSISFFLTSSVISTPSKTGS
jgi:ATP-dependent DNA helicase